MINADRDIILFNLRYDANQRREVFIPTNISGVTLYDARSSSGTESRNENLAFKIRIPITAQVEADRTYIDEFRYKALSDEDAEKYWTLQKGCYILTGALFYPDWEFDSFNFRSGVITQERLREIQAMRQYDGDFITVVEYADNTKRGSDMVKHWRIGGN